MWKLSVIALVFLFMTGCGTAEQKKTGNVPVKKASEVMLEKMDEMQAENKAEFKSLKEKIGKVDTKVDDVKTDLLARLEERCRADGGSKKNVPSSHSAVDVDAIAEAFGRGLKLKEEADARAKALNDKEAERDRRVEELAEGVKNLSASLDDAIDPGKRSLVTRVRQHLEDTQGELIKAVYPNVDKASAESWVFEKVQNCEPSPNKAYLYYPKVIYWRGIKVKIWISNVLPSHLYFKVISGGIEPNGEQANGDDKVSLADRTPRPATPKEQKEIDEQNRILKKRHKK